MWDHCSQTGKWRAAKAKLAGCGSRARYFRHNCTKVPIISLITLAARRAIRKICRICNDLKKVRSIQTPLEMNGRLTTRHQEVQSRRGGLCSDMFAYVRICSLFWKNGYAGVLGRGISRTKDENEDEDESLQPAATRTHFAFLILKFWRILAFLYGFYAIEQ